MPFYLTLCISACSILTRVRSDSRELVVSGKFKNRFDEFLVKICHGGWCPVVGVVGQQASFTGLPFLSRLRSPDGVVP